MTRTPQSSYQPPACAIQQHGAKVTKTHKAVYSTRERWARVAVVNGQTTCALCDYGDTSGIERRPILDENYEGCRNHENDQVP